MIEKVTLHLTKDSKLMPEKGVDCQELNPKILMLYAAAKCAGLTTLSIMQKEHMQPKGFEISLSGELSGDPAQGASIFKSFHAVYNFQCASQADQLKASHAAKLAHEKYCGMMQMLRQIAPVSHEIAVVNTEPAKV